MTNTLRVRFSGLCMFHEENGSIVARVVMAHGHTPQLWLNLATGRNKSPREADGISKECALAWDSETDTVTADWQTVEKYTLNEEEIRFETGNGDGPDHLPGVAPLREVHPGLRGINKAKGVGAIITLNHGQFQLVPKWRVQWQDPHLGAPGPNELPLWTDLLITTNDATFKIVSTAGDWDLEPNNNQQVEVWILADRRGGSGRHFRHLYDYCHGVSAKPWPKLQDDLPKCALSLLNSRRVGSTFCPDGQY